MAAEIFRRYLPIKPPSPQLRRYSIVFGLSGYLGKVWADRALEKQRQENAQLNLQLTSQLGLITEERRHLLQLRLLEQQVRFSKLHEKRGEVLADVYKRLVESERLCEAVCASPKK